LVHIGEDLPDYIAEAFLKEVVACPDCARAMAERKVPERERSNDH
jgi:hypothetical protein